MILTLGANEITGWSTATLLTSSFTFFIVICYIFINSVYKRGTINRSAFISALFSLCSVAIVFAYDTNSYIKLNALFVFHGIQYAFAFHTMLYTFYCNIVQANGEDKALVYIGYIWMFVTIGVSFAATLMTNTIEWNYYDSSYMEHIYNVVAITMLSSWGFIAVIILLYIRNNQLFNVDNATSVVIYIFLVLIQAITTTVILYGSSNSNGAHPAVVFFLTDVPMYIAIIIAAHFGPVWIGDELKIKKVNGNTKSDDLEANRGSN